MQININVNIIDCMYNIDIKEFRRVNNMTQRDLADYLGIKVQGYISQMENGERPIPVKYICRILADNSKDSSMVKVFDPDDEVKMSREVFDKISRLIDTVCSQQETIASQQQTLKNYGRLDRQTDAPEVKNAGSADAE